MLKMKISRSTLSCSEMVTLVASLEAASRESISLLFATVRTEANVDLPILAWEEELNGESQPLFKEVAAVAIAEALVKQDGRQMSSL